MSRGAIWFNKSRISLREMNDHDYLKKQKLFYVVWVYKKMPSFE